MTLIEFNEAAKAIIAKAGWEGCQFSTTAETQNYAGSTTCNFNYRIAAHPQGVMLTSYDTGFDYFCNNPTLALERFQSAVDRRLAPPSEPEAITEIEAESLGSETVYMLQKPETTNDTKGEWVMFGELAIGQRFSCYGDTMINYDYPKWCECVKHNESLASEVNGCSFPVNPTDVVFVSEKVESEVGNG